MHRLRLLLFATFTLMLVSTLYYSTSVSALPSAPPASGEAHVLSFLVTPTPLPTFDPLSPVRLTMNYVEPFYPNSVVGATPQTKMSPKDVANTFDYVIYDAKRGTPIPSYRAEGWTGEARLYVILNGMDGPERLRVPGNQGRVCVTAENTWRPLGNNIMYRRDIDTSEGVTNDFCNLHSAIASGGTFDHDTDPATTAVNPDENWFLHEPTRTPVPAGRPPSQVTQVNPIVDAAPYSRAPVELTPCADCRVLDVLTGVRRDLLGAEFRPNPGIPLVREMFGERIRRLYVSNPAYRGVFLDNTEFTADKLIQNAAGVPKEYNPATGRDQFVQDVRSMVERINQSVPNPPIWGNMITDYITPAGWQVLDPPLEGGMQEFFAFNDFTYTLNGVTWNRGCPRPPTQIEQQMQQAENWMGTGNHYFVIAHSYSNILCPLENAGDGSASWKLDLFKKRGAFGLGVFLMVTDGNNASYRLSDRLDGQQPAFYALPEYYRGYGPPLSDRVKISDSPLRYQRRFAHCTIEVDLTNATATFGINGTPCPPRSYSLFLPLIGRDGITRAPQPRPTGTLVAATVVPLTTPTPNGYPGPNPYPGPPTNTPTRTLTPTVVTCRAVTWTNLVNAAAQTDDIYRSAGANLWDAGGISVQRLTSGNGTLRFRAQATTSNRMAGLGTGNSSQHYNDIEHAWYLTNGGALNIYESGTNRGSFGNYRVGDVMEIRVSGGVVRYYHAGTLKYTSTVAPTYPLVADTSLYSAGARVADVALGAGACPGLPTFTPTPRLSPTPTLCPACRGGPPAATPTPTEPPAIP